MAKVYNLSKESASPMIGIFWIYKGQILQFAESVQNVPPGGGFKDSNFTHDAYWSQVQRMYPELADKEYFDIPRGRVLFVINGVYRTILPTVESKNSTLVSRIILNFSLPKGKTVVTTDQHYDPPANVDWDEEE